VLGEGRTLKEFEGAFLGMKPGESKSFDVTFPPDYFAKNLAGKTATFEVSVKSVQESHLPEVDEAFAQSMGIHTGGAAKLREEVATNLKREAKRRIQTKVKEQVMDGLLAVTPFEVPKGLVAMECRTLLSRAVSDLKARGMREQDIKMNESIFEPQAKRRVALSLLLNALAESHQIKVDEAQVRALVDEFAQSYEDPSEVVTWYYQDAARLREAQSLVLEDNIVNWVLERAQVTDESTSLEQLMGKA
jgi:trigger factor